MRAGNFVLKQYNTVSFFYNRIKHFFPIFQKRFLIKRTYKIYDPDFSVSGLHLCMNDCILPGSLCFTRRIE